MQVIVRRYIPKDEAIKRMKNIKKRLKKEKLNKVKRKNNHHDNLSDTESDSAVENRSPGEKRRSKKKKKNLFSVSSSSESESSSDEEARTKSVRKRPASAVRRPGSAMAGFRVASKKSGHNGSSDSESDSDFTKSRPQSAGKRSISSHSRFGDKEDNESDNYLHRRMQDKYAKDQRSSSASAERIRRESLSSRRVSTSASSLRKDQYQAKKKGVEDNDHDVDEVKQPLFEECVFMCNRWLATDEDDGLSVRELKISERRTFYREN